MLTMEFKEISKESLEKAFEAAAIESDPDEERDNTLYLQAGLEFPVWLHILSETKTIRLNTYMKFKEYAPVDRMHELANDMNASFIMDQFSVSDEADDGAYRLECNYVIYTGFGIVVPQLVHTVRLFADIFHCACVEKDPHDIFFE